MRCTAGYCAAMSREGGRWDVNGNVSGVTAYLQARIETQSPIELCAIGIKHDVSPYYKTSPSGIARQALCGYAEFFHQIS
ncbi:cobaltochelatase CobT-related protein [Pacificibacter marinus]|uniref:cobaltochelatase CobT-related protein n=1 Tax=Pacificibacter marinus TaxID=658057 RepID=UPI001C079B6A|nr:hypothetical protein [Pacificibacter marinus]